VSGGTAPYRTSATALAGTWHLDSDPDHPGDPAWFRLTGTPAGPTTLTLTFVGSDDRMYAEDFEIKPRAACWFAYVRLAAGQPELVLVDPILKKTPPIALVNDHGVYDFRFSPNGRFLAYRYGQQSGHPSRAHLALIDLVTWQERALSFDSEDAVTAFTWSADSLTLIAAYEGYATPGGTTLTTHLGGVRMSLGTSGALQPVTLTPVQAYVQSDLYWAAQDSVVFHAALLPKISGQFYPNPLQLRTPYYAKLGTQGFSSPQPMIDEAYESDASLDVQPTPSGFFMISGSTTYFYPLNPPGTALIHSGNVVSPSGAYTAVVVEGELELFRAMDDGEEDSPFAHGPSNLSCPGLLSWAKGRERLACVANVDNDPSGTSYGALRIIDLDGAVLSGNAVQGFCVKQTNGVTIQHCVGLEYDYGEQRSQSQPRVFSPSGNWFAFSTSALDGSGDDYLYLADLRSSSFVLKRKDFSDVSPATSGIALGFSPDEHYLLQQRGAVLTVHDVPDTGSGRPLQKLPTRANHSPVNCSEDFGSARDRWCGDAQTAALFTWSAESGSFVYRTQQGLQVVDLAEFPTLDTSILPADECQDQCSNQFDFQPLP
jgi:hypothetical protein